MAAPNNTGKKYRTIDRNLILRLASIQCSLPEIAEAANTNVETLKRRFMDVIEQGRAQGKQSLRRVQFDKALQGDTKMLIWLGKQVLKQRDQVDDSEGTQPLPWRDED